jgi:hypothetical protein
MARRVDPERAAMWRERFDRLQQSPMTVTQFCRAEGFSAKSFYYWRQRLTKGSGEEATRKSASQSAAKAESPSKAFAPVRLIGGAHLAACLPGGTRLEIPLADPAAARVALEAILLADGRRADAEAALGAEHTAKQRAGKRRQGGAAC